VFVVLSPKQVFSIFFPPVTDAESFQVDLIDAFYESEYHESGCEYLTVGSCPLRTGETYEYTKNTKVPYPRHGNKMRFYLYSTNSHIGCSDVYIVDDWNMMLA
jgi:hypothetical protein